MPVVMEAPAKYIADIALGKIIRYGAILKDAGTGQIIGHLKEAGQMGELLSTVAKPLFTASKLTPLSMGIDAVGHAVSAYQLQGIKQTLKGLTLTTNIAAISSIAGLGISVAGFAVINNKLKKVEAKLDAVANDLTVIKKVLNNMHKSWELMSNAQLQNAAAKISTAEKAETKERYLELAKEGVSDFSLLRQYYSNILSEDNLFDDPDLNLSLLHELISRYTFASLGELQAEFMIGDLGSYRQRLETVINEFSNRVSFSPKNIYLSRCDKLEALTLDFDHNELSKSLTALSQYTNETTERMESHMVELEYLEKNSLTVAEYLKALREHDTDIVLIPR